MSVTWSSDANRIFSGSSDGYVSFLNIAYQLISNENSKKTERLRHEITFLYYVHGEFLMEVVSLQGYKMLGCRSHS